MYLIYWAEEESGWEVPIFALPTRTAGQGNDEQQSSIFLSE